MDSHIDAEQLELYSLGDISEDSAAKIETHLLQCESCRAQLTAADEYIRAMQDAATELRKPAERPKSSSASA